MADLYNHSISDGFICRVIMANLHPSILVIVLSDGFICRVIMADLHNLSISDGAEAWRRKEAEELSDLVQRRIHYLQVLNQLTTIIHKIAHYSML